MNYNKVKFMTGNLGKFEDLKTVIPGLLLEKPLIDVEEVESQDPYLVALYKAKDMYVKNNMNSFMLIEDTSLFIEGEEIGTNIKHLKHRLPDLTGKKAKWITVISSCDGFMVKSYVGISEGVISKETGVSNNGFDRYFIPNGEKLTLSELHDIGKKAPYSARIKAGEKFQSDTRYEQEEMTLIPDWTGEYQKEN